MQRFYSYILIITFGVLSFTAKAQSGSPAFLGQPTSNPIVDYDAATGNYLYYYSFDTKKTLPYKILTPEEHRREQFLNTLRQGWDRQSSGGKSGPGARDNNFMPTSFSVNSDIFKTVFGSTEISIIPQGSVEVGFGINYNYTDNPIIPEKYRGNTSFDFNTKMMLNIDASIGDRIKFNWNYNTEATFDFETNLKIEYVGNEDDILQRIEAGNVSLPLEGTLITGNQGLFGIRTDLRFGKLDLTTIFSRQDTQAKTVEVQGGSGQTTLFEINADEYDANRHFFLNQYFRANYDRHLSRLPLILSGVNIKRIEVWVTNKSAKFEDSRDVVAFIDLAEPDEIFNSMLTQVHGGFPDTLSNNLLSIVESSQIRNMANATSYLSGRGFRSGEDFEKLQNARKLNTNEYTLNAQLGYISLNQSLNNDEVLAVAYEYEAGGITYYVGELSTDGIGSPNALVVKLLKGTTLSPSLPTWKLMMKNIYSLDAYTISPKDFILDVYYENSEAGTAVPYIAEGNIANKPLIRVLNLDNLNSQNDPYPDGMFDFMEGVTVLSSKGKIIFPVLEPFGRYLEQQINNSAIAERYVYKELYDSTLVKARSLPEKNRFKLMGSYVSSSGTEIRLNAMNIPQGSVVVTAGGVKLQENIDYEVNYMMGTVRILNRAYLESGMPIRISMEDRQLFNMQTKTLIGAHLKYRFNEDFYIGATILNLSERPMTQKVSWGNEAISNTIWGVNTAYRMEAPFITKALNFLPLFSTKEKSSITFEAEFAQFLPGHAGAIDGSSGGMVFIDDFEGSKTSLDLRAVNSWVIASTPQGQNSLFPEGNLAIPDLSYGFNRARLAWYSIYPEFLRRTAYTPSYMRSNPGKYLENHYVREIPVRELFPDRELTVGSPTSLAVFNMAFYPSERGPYNYDDRPGAVNVDGSLQRSEERWGGIMRSLPVTDFEAANYDYIEFWLMDPFVHTPNARGGKLYFNLGNISEDILKDGLKFFENGLPPFGDAANPLGEPDTYIETIWGRVPSIQALTQTFENDPAKLAYQDVGYDGLDNERERWFFRDYLDRLRGMVNGTAYQTIYDDPSGDDYKYYLDASYDASQATILDRYKYYNNQDGNSTPGSGDQNNIGTTLPDMEDINRDFTMNESESYYQYEINLTPQDLAVGRNYITDSRTSLPAEFPNNPGAPTTVTWYQFKIPISEGRSVGAIQDLKSVRFIRMFMRGFNDTTILRFATLELVRGEWRRYNQSLLQGQEGTAQPEMPNAIFDISTVNIEENASRTPVNYVLPPGTTRQIDPGEYQTRQLNEQSMLLKVTDLADGDARAAYKNVDFDFRQYRRLKMDIHAEAIPGYVLNNNDVSLIIRVGTDYRYNYYEYEIPLSVTRPGYYNDNQREEVWPLDNKLDIDLELFTNLKLERNARMKAEGGSLASIYEKKVDKPVINPNNYPRNTVRIVGNPNLGSVRALMVGIRNPAKLNNPADDGLSKSTVVWINELRLTNFDESSGYAANARISTKLADLGNVTVSGNMMTPNFGGLESKINDRSQVYMYQYDIAANLELGKFFPSSFGVRLPVFFGFMENYTTPKYNPFDQDIKLNDALHFMSPSERDSLRNMVMDYKQRLALNFTNVRVATNNTDQKALHLSNLYTSFAYNRMFAQNPRLHHQEDVAYYFNLGYAYNVQPYYIEPFKNVKWLQPKFLRLIKEFSLSPYPNQFSFNTDINRTYNEMQIRAVAAPDVIIPPTAAKDFTWDRTYNLNWDLTRSIRIDFSANNRARIDEPEGVIDKRNDPEGYRHWHDSTWNNFWRFGRNVQYYHRYDLTWQVPINKLPLLDWTNASLRYGGSYDWQAAPLMKDDLFNPGNTIGNARNINASLMLSLENLYNKSSFLKDINDEFSGRSRKRKEMVDVHYESPKMNFANKQRRTIRHRLNTDQVVVKVTAADGTEVEPTTVDIVDKNSVLIIMGPPIRDVKVSITGKVPKKEDPWNYTGKLMLRLAMMVRNVSVMYNSTEATMVPGFMPNSQLLGMNFNTGWAPGWGFVFGAQDENFVEKARRLNWLSSDPSVTSPFMMNNTNTWYFRATLEPITNLRIELQATRGFTANRSTYNIATPSDQFQISGNFNISVFTLATTFESPNSSNDYFSKSFQSFLDNRGIVARRLAADRASKSTSGYSGAIDPATGYPDGYGSRSPEVMIPAFLAAYTGQSAEKVTLKNFFNIPIPNWRITYSGLSNIPALKGIITMATLMHSYNASYAINSYMSNQKYDEQQDGFSYVRNAVGNFIAPRDLMNVSLTEEFSPLLYIDLGWYNNLSTHIEWIRSRRIGLSLSNDQISEFRTNEWRVGGGYTFNEFPLLFRFLNNRSSATNTILRLRADVSIRNDLSIMRTPSQNLNEDTYNTVISDGKETISIQCSADYTVSASATIRVFFDRVVNKPRVSTIATANTSFGFSLNLSLAQ
ncbi:MAG: cell surface protein SprA [Bacteroidales bacterium]|nr:cell surface protein SprA [Bacteroidales bacterium]